MKLVKTKLQNGLDFWYREDDKYIGQRIALRKYEEYETMLMLSQVNRESVVVDVGANIGYYTLLLANICKKVYAFEPDADCFEILKKNVEANKLKNIILINKAVGDKNEQRGMIKDKSNFGNSKIVKGVGIECIRLDDVIKEKIGLMKIDVQGFEEKVIEGAKELIKNYSPILFMEYNGGNLDFLKSIYRNIYSIDYWFYVCRKGIYPDSKTGYTDLWIKKSFSLRDWWWTIKKVQIKKVIKAILTRLTG